MFPLLGDDAVFIFTSGLVFRHFVASLTDSG